MPVVATRVGGIPEIVGAPQAGVLVDDLRPETIARGIAELLSRLPDRRETRAYAERFGWDETTQGQLHLFRRVLGDPKGDRSRA